ncbi:MAG: metal-dependent hydrolase [Candidatus Bathyarchaeia archaeon]
MEPLLHFTIPFLSFLLVGVQPTKAFLLSLLALVPDLDALFLVHRSFTHSIVCISIILLIAVLMLRKFRSGMLRYAFMGFFAIASHLVLDVFTGFTPILWPLYNFSIWISLDITAHVGSLPSLMLHFTLLKEPITFVATKSLDAPIFTSYGLAIVAVLLMPVLISLIKIRRT